MKNFITDWDEWDGAEIMMIFFKTMAIAFVLAVFILFVIFIFSKEVTLIILCAITMCIFWRSKDQILKPFKKWLRFKVIKTKKLKFL